MRFAMARATNPPVSVNELLCWISRRANPIGTAVIRSGCESSQMWTNTARSKRAAVFCFMSGVENNNGGREGWRL